MTVLSYSYDIIMDHKINSPDLGNNVFDGINATDKRYLKGEMEIIDKSASNNTSKIVMIPSASKEVSIKFVDQYIHITNNEEISNGLKGSTRTQNK